MASSIQLQCRRCRKRFTVRGVSPDFSERVTEHFLINPPQWAFEAGHSYITVEKHYKCYGGTRTIEFSDFIGNPLERAVEKATLYDEPPHDNNQKP